MQILITDTADAIVVVKITGEMDLDSAGHLLDVLVENVGGERTRLIVDLSGVPRVTPASVRGLAVAAKLSQTNRGQMRICGATPSVEACLRSRGFDHLLKFDPDRAVSIAILIGAGRRETMLSSAPPCARNLTGEMDNITVAGLPFVEEREPKRRALTVRNGSQSLEAAQGQLR